MAAVKTIIITTKTIKSKAGKQKTGYDWTLEVSGHSKCHSGNQGYVDKPNAKFFRQLGRQLIEAADNIKEVDKRKKKK